MNIAKYEFNSGFPYRKTDFICHTIINIFNNDLLLK